MRYRDIPQFTSRGNYSINLEWAYLLEWLERQLSKDDGLAPLDLDPDFQRGHVWTEEQQIRFVEFVLRGGANSSGNNLIRFNCVGFRGSYIGPFVIVDGKQRLNAAVRFLNNEIPVFGNIFKKDFEDKIPSYVEFIVQINNLKTRKEVLQWYLEINSGGVVHTSKEIQRVKDLLELELANE